MILDENQVPTGQTIQMKGDSLFDLHSYPSLNGQNRLNLIEAGGKTGIDHPFLIQRNDSENKLIKVAELVHPDRKMKVYTD